jgi:hypothetical protein
VDAKWHQEKNAHSAEKLKARERLQRVVVNLKNQRRTEHRKRGLAKIKIKLNINQM